jgi:Ca2+-binding RTX toxin-like protein
VTINIVDFGAVGDGRTDNRGALQRAFDQAKATGQDVYIPAGVFAHSGTLTADGIKIAGAGEGSVLKATQQGQEALILHGSGAELSDLRMEGVGGPRINTYEAVGVLVDHAQNFRIENVHIQGTSGAGIIATASSQGYIANNIVENSGADSIHMVVGSHDILVERNRILHSGDDGISVVSYQGGGMVSNVTIRDNEVLYNEWGRGITAAGGRDILIEHNNVVGGAADRAGIYVSAEAEWGTESAHNVRVSGNTITDAGGLSSGHGAILLYNSRPGLVNDGVTVTNNEIINPRKMGILVSGEGEQHLAVYDNRISGSSNGDLVNLNPNASVSTDPPPGGTNVVGAEGADQITGAADAQALDGSSSDNTPSSAGGDEQLVGTAGAEPLVGGDGNDTLDGGAGDDRMTGGAGADTFVFARGDNADIVADLEAGVDKVDLSAFGLGDMAGLTSSAKVTSDSNTVSIDFGGGDRLTILGLSKLTADNVIF